MDSPQRTLMSLFPYFLKYVYNGRKEGYEMKRQHTKDHQHSDIVRFTLDIPAEQHAYLKMLAAKKGISMREYVLESLSKSVESEVENVDLRENKFKKILKNVIAENDDVLRRLADK